MAAGATKWRTKCRGAVLFAILLQVVNGYEEVVTISQLSPKSAGVDLPQDAILQTTQSDNLAFRIEPSVGYDDVDEINPEDIVTDEESEKHVIVERSAAPTDRESRSINFDEIPSSNNEIDNELELHNKRKYYEIHPTKTIGLSHENEVLMSSELGDKFEFNFPGEARRAPKARGLPPLGPRVRPTAVQPMYATIGPNEGRQNTEIQNIITGIVKLLNGNVNVQANTQLLRPGRPMNSRINNRGPPRISDVAPLPEFDNKPITPPTHAFHPTKTPPPYPFDRPPHGVNLPEQIVPPLNPHRPGFHRPNLPPWQRPRPRPPQMPNRRPNPGLPIYKPTPPPMPVDIPQLDEEEDPENETNHDNHLVHDDKETVSSEVPVTNTTEENERDDNKLTTAPETTSSTTTSTTTTSTTTTTTTEKTTTSTTEKTTTEPPTTTTEKAKTTTEKAKTTTEKPKTTTEAKTTTEKPKTTTEIKTTTEKAKLEKKPEKDKKKEPFNKDKYKIDEKPVNKTKIETIIDIIESSIDEYKASSAAAAGATPTDGLISHAPTISASENAHSVVKTSAINAEPFPSSSTPYRPYRRPGIVLDDPDFKPKGTRYRQPDAPVVTAPGFGEIFDVTVSAIQGPGEKGHGASVHIQNVNPISGHAEDDIIVSPSGEQGFVSIDGKRTYLNLFDTSSHVEVKPTRVQSVQQSAPPAASLPHPAGGPAVGTGVAVPAEPEPAPPHPHPPRPHRPPYRRPQPTVRIDTCIVGDDSTCDQAQNEKCRTEAGISSCQCRPGYARRVHRDPCRRVVALVLNLRVDRLYDRKVAWDAKLADKDSEPYQQLSYEAVRAIDSAFSMTPFSDDFVSGSVNSVHRELGPGVYVNYTILMQETAETLRPAVASEIQKHVLGVLRRRSNNVGASALWVDSVAGAVAPLQDLDECASSEYNDCHQLAYCINTWGGFRCACPDTTLDTHTSVLLAGRECRVCSNSHCNERGSCRYYNKIPTCSCSSGYYGSTCEVDGEVVGVAVGASLAAALVIALTLAALLTWSRKWSREQKAAGMGSPVFSYMPGVNTIKAPPVGAPPYQVTLEERMRWAQIAEAMAQSNHYAGDPNQTMATRPSSAMFGGYPTLPPVPMPRLGLHHSGTLNTVASRANTSASHHNLYGYTNHMATESTSSEASSHVQERADLLHAQPRPKSRARSMHNQTGIYYDVEYENAPEAIYGTKGIPLSTYTAHSPSGCVAGLPARVVLFVLFVSAAHENDPHPSSPIAMEDLGVLHAVAARLALGMIQDGGPVGVAGQEARIDWLPMSMIRDQEVPMLTARGSIDINEGPQSHLPCLPRPSHAVPQSNLHVNKSYASTYQVAHCGANAYSPTTCVTEFPPQKPNPSPRTQLQGNFEVGVGNAVNRSPPNTESFRKIRHDEGRGCAIRPDRDVDAFVSSLRKYPAQRTPSSDLIERLLKTHSFPKDATETSKTPGDKHATKEQRNPQTPRRSRKEENRRPGFKRPGTQNVKQTRAPLNKSPLNSAVEMYEERITSFDYLNSGVAWLPGADKTGKRENGTLENVFRDLYHDERGPVMAFPICPAMQCRYEKHVKKCHQPTTSQTAHVDVSSFKTCTKCLKRRPCPCEALKSVRLNADKQQEEKRALEDAIFSWLNEIPIYPNEKPHDRFIRDAIVKKLAETLNGIKEEDIPTQGKEAIRKAIDKLPMWYPKDESDRDSFINNITDSLLDKIKAIKDKRKIRKAAADFIDKLNFDNIKDVDREQILNDITKELNKLSLNRPEDDDLYRDMIKIKAFELLDHLPIKVRGNRYEYLNKLSDDFADRIMEEENSSQGTMDQDTNDIMKEEITEILDSSNASIKERGKVEGLLQKAIADIVRRDMGDNAAVEHIKSVLKGKVSDDKIKDIAEQVVTLADRVRPQPVDQETKQIIKENINDILDESSVNINNRDKVEDRLHKAVANIVTQRMDKEKATAHIKSALKGMIPNDKLENIAEQVLAMTDQIKSIKAKTIDVVTSQKIKENISEIFNESGYYHRNRGKVEESLQKAVADIVRRDIDHSKAVARIKTVLKGKVPDDKIEDIIEQVLNMVDQVRSDESNTIDPETKQIIREDISNILDLSDVRVKNRGKVEDSLQKVVADIVGKGMDESKAVAHIKTVLKGKVPDDKIEDIIEQVLNMADQVRPDESKTIDPETKQIIREDISNILDLSDVRVKNRGKVEDSLQKVVADIVGKGMDESKAVAHIKTVLKGKVPDDKIEDIAEQVLTLAGQVKPSESKTIDQETKNIIKEDIIHILDFSDVSIKNRGKLEDSLQRAIADIVGKDMKENKAVAHIKAVLKGKVPDDKIEDIAEQVLTLADQARPGESKTITRESKQIIKEDISNILDLSHVSIRNRDSVEDSLRKAIADIVEKDMDESKALARIKIVLKGKVPDGKIEDIAEQLLTLADQVRPNESKIDRESKKIIKEDISHILDISDVRINNRGKVEEILQKAVADIVNSDMHPSKAIARIKTVLKGKVPDDKIEDIAEQVMTLADQVRPGESNAIDRETKKLLKEDINNILDGSDFRIKNRGKVEEGLQKAIAEIVGKDMNQSKAVAHIKSVLKGKIPDDKIEDIAEQVLTLADQVRPDESKSIDRETKQIIKEDISNILDLSNARIKNRGKVEDSLQKAVAEIVRKDMDQNRAVAYIKTVLKGKVPDDKVEDIVEQVLTLADQVRSEGSKIDQETNQIINEDINNILDLSNARIKNRGKVQDSLNKAVANIINKNMGKDQAMTHIKNALKGKVSDDKIEDIAKQVLTLADDVKPDESTKIDQGTTRIIKEDISDILDLSNVPIKNRDKIEKKLQKTVANIVAKGLSKEKAMSHIKSVLKGKVPEETADDIAQQILKSVDRSKPPMMMAMAEGDQSMFDSSLQQNISDILDRTSSRITNRSKVEESIRDVLKDLVMRGIDEREAQNQIHSLLKGKVSDSQADNISKQLLELAHQLSTSLDDYGPSASSTQNAEAMFSKQVYEVVRDWLNSQSMIKLNERDLKKVVEAISNDVIDRQKYLQLNPGVKTSDEKECEILREQVYKALYKLIDTQSVLSVMSKVDNLTRSLNTIPKLLGTGRLVQDSKEFVQENMEGALLDWLRGSPVYHRDSRMRQAQERVMSNLAESLTTVLSSLLKEKPSAKTDEILLKEITKQLEELPVDPQFKSKEYLRMLSIHMLDYLKSLQLFQDISLRTGANDTQRNTSFMPSTNHLSDIVRDWCETLPLPDQNGGYEMKQDLANKIILKIGELNMNQDVFNDDLLYEEMLQEFIDQQVKALQIPLDVPGASKQLIDEIMNMKQKVQDSLVVRAYRQQLRDTMSDVLPSIVNPTEEDRAAFELMKENLADAFINLHYSGEDEAIKAKLKRRITDEINKFANDYLGCCPAPPISARELNENLYKALLNVPVPSDDASMRSEVEAVRLKDVVYNWLKILPLSKQTKVEQLHTNKIITIMCQKLQELESEFNPDFEEIAKEEIKKYLTKLPLKNKSNLDRMAKILVDRIINTSEARSFVERPSTALRNDICLSKTQCLPHQQHHTGISSRASYLTCSSPTCKTDKKTKLIDKGRSQRCEMGTQSTKCCCNDAAVDPSPSDNMSQTEVRPVSKCCQCDNKSEPVCKPRVIRIINAPPTESIGSQADLCPYVRKGYHSDCVHGDRRDFSNQTLTPGIRRCAPPLIPSREVCAPHDHDYIGSGWCGMAHRPRSCRRNFPRGPRRQILSACPNEYIRPKSHNCVRPRNVLPHPARCRHAEPGSSRRKQPCLTCHDHEVPFCPKCRPNIPCPHPTRLYFR